MNLSPEPDFFKTRGFMLDISRGKIPSLETLYHLVDLLSRYHYNHLELYIEGFSYAYSFYKPGLEGKDALTPEQLQKLDSYCAEKKIELVPAQNSLGHMAPWLQTEHYHHLAEVENSSGLPPSTLNVCDPESLSLIEQMLSDLLPHFHSDKVNVCLDEPFELGSGKSKELAEKLGRDALYLQYLLKLYDYLKENGKSMYMWGDIARTSSSILEEIPKDVVLLEWGYDADHPFHKNASTLQEHGCRFCICSGTSTWTSFTGMTDNMLQNIRNAADTAYRYDAEGMILTDWGDFGHLQPLSASYPALIYHGELAYKNKALSDDELAFELDQLLETDGIGFLILESGRYYQLEEYQMECKTMAYLPLIREEFGNQMSEDDIAELFAGWGTSPIREKYQASFHNRATKMDDALPTLLDQLINKWARLNPTNPEAVLVKQEYMSALSLVHALTLRRKGIHKSYLHLDKLFQDLETVWMKRDLRSDLDKNMNVLRNILN